MYDDNYLPPIGGMGSGYGPGMFAAQQKKKQQGFNPLMFMSPFAFGMSQNPMATMSLMSPAFGIAHMLGAFK